MREFTDEEKALVFRVIAEECGASWSFIIDFRFHFPECREYRFQGDLGFGGKVWYNPSMSHQSVYVTCYSEDETPLRLAAIERANARLATLDA